MRYDVLSPTSGESKILGSTGWPHLLVVASRRGGLPVEGLHHYCEAEDGAIHEAAGDVAEAPARAGKGPESPRPRGPGGLAPSEEAPPVDPEEVLAFRAGREEIVSRSVRMGRTGELEVTRHRS